MVSADDPFDKAPFDLPPKITPTVARWFHEAYELLAPTHGYKTRKASAVPWEDVPAANKALMFDTVAVVLSRLADSGVDLSRFDGSVASDKAAKGE